MDLSFAPEEQAFALQVREWLLENVEIPPRFENIAAEVEFGRRWQARLATNRWVGIHWPEEYGGRGASPIEVAIFNMEYARSRALQPINRVGINLAGPTLLAHGTDDQKARWLPAILTADEIWCQLFSEPEAGSDLASLRTRAERDGDEYVINGQKVWTSMAHFSQYGILIARTDPDAPKHQGISYFICPMKTPGIEVRPLIEMTGAHIFNEVFLTDVRLPKENLVGEENGGWALAKVTLGNERVSLSSGGALWGNGPSYDDLLRLVQQRGGVADVSLRQRLAQLYIESELLRLIRLRTVTAAVKGKPPGAEASIRKLLADEHGQKLMELAKDLCGADGMLADHGPLHGPDEHGWHYGFLFARALTIGGGTTQVQRNIVAERVLDLPHDVDVEQGKSWREARVG